MRNILIKLTNPGNTAATATGNKDKQMKLPAKLVLYVIILMSIAAGLAKVFQMPQEIGLFEEAGLSPTLMVLLGILQAAGGGMALVERARQLGLLMVSAGFAASVIIIAMAGDMTFAAVSALPVLVSIGLMLYTRKAESSL